MLIHPNPTPGPGLPVTIKANIAVKGLPFHAGIAAYRNRIATEDATCVARLRAHGAAILGLVNMHEGALGGTTDNPWFGRTENPCAPGYTAGGSSGGSAAAVASGLCAVSLGTDTLGSVRIPAGYCGVFGHKPMAGLVPMDGVIPLSPRTDTVGILAGSAEECALVLGWLTDGSEVALRPRRQANLAVLDVSGGIEIVPEVAEALLQTTHRAKQAGHGVERLILPNFDYGRLRRLALLLLELDAEQEHRAALAACPEGFSSEFRGLLAWAVAQPPARVEAARREVRDMSAYFLGATADFDAVLAPTTPQPAFAWNTPVPSNQADITCLASVAGLAATAFPVGRVGGLPLSVQVISREDSRALEVACGLARK